jgi:hypothetical protein
MIEMRLLETLERRSGADGVATLESRSTSHELHDPTKARLDAFLCAFEKQVQMHTHTVT